MKKNKLCSFVVFSVLFHISLFSVKLMGNEHDAKDPALLIGRPDREVLSLAIRNIRKGNERDLLVVLVELFIESPRDNEYLALSKIRKSALEAAISMAGTCEKARAFLKEVVCAYMKTGSRSKSVQYPFQGDEEYRFVMLSVFPALSNMADIEMEEWFLEVFKNGSISYRIREFAYEGFLLCKEKKIPSKKDRIDWLSKMIRSPGQGELCYFYGPADERHGLFGKRDWAIQDTASCRALIHEGVDALPTLEKEWERLEHGKDLSTVEKRRQYGLAYVIASIRRSADLPIDRRLATRPPDWLEQGTKKVKELEAARDADGADGSAPTLPRP